MKLKIALFHIFLIFNSYCLNTLRGIDIHKINSLKSKPKSPDEILKVNDSIIDNENIKLELKQSDPLEYMKLKEEIMNLYMKKPRFKQNEDSSEKNSSSLVTKPTAIGKKGDPENKEFHNEEEIVQIKRVWSSSFYNEMNSSKPVSFPPISILKDDASFWCSSGNHDFNSEVTFDLELERSSRISALWIHWAFAPAEYMIKYKNEKNQNWLLMTPGFKQSRKEGTLNWWKSVISNPKTRWKYKSFDERFDLDEPVWLKYIQIVMRVPVNQYYGLYKVELYTKTKAVVMLKSKKPGENTCLSVVNGILANYSPVIAIDCLQAIAYGDNRDLFVLHSNGYITTFREKKCMESPSEDKVDIVDCGISSDYKDDREKWILDFDGKIRSFKEEFTCLTITDLSVKDEIPVEDMKASASSVQNDGIHGPDKAIDMDITTYWASDPSLNEVIFELYFPKYPYVIKELVLDWKFPAKSFKIMGLFPDGFWKLFKKSSQNRDTTTVVNMMNRDIIGIKIIMTESTTQIQEKHIYGITYLNLRFGGRYLNREPCSNILLEANKFEIIDVTILDEVTGNEFKKANAELHQTRTKMGFIQKMYAKVPDTIMRMKETSVTISDKLKSLGSLFADIKLKLSKFEDLLENEKIQIFTIAANEYFPVINCANIIKAFPSKRSGIYWIKNDCMNKPMKVYCDFDSYDYKGGLDYLIYNQNQQVNVPMKINFKNYNDIRYQCNLLGMEPLEIKNDNMIRIAFNLLKIFNYDISANFIIPFGYDYNCDVSKCSGDFKSINDINSGSISDIINNFIKEYESGLAALFRNSSSGDGNEVKNVAAFGKGNSAVYEKLSSNKISAVICSTNNDGSKEKKDYINIECDTNLRSDIFAEYQIYANLRLVCPPGCSHEKIPVYGSGIYTDNSGVCRAAIHSGVLKDEGGIIEVHFETGRKNYNGSVKFNIESSDFPDPWDRSFTVQKYSPYCPIEKLKEFTVDIDTSSFMELSVEAETLSKLMSKLNDPKKEKLIDETKKTSNIEKEKSIEINPNDKKNSTETRNSEKEKFYEEKLINEINKLAKEYEFIKGEDNSISSNRKFSEVINKLANLSKFMQEDLSNKSKDIIQNKSEIGPGMIDMRNSAINTTPQITSQAVPVTSVVPFRKEAPTVDTPINNIELLKVLEEKNQELNSIREEKNMKNMIGFETPTSRIETEQALQYIQASYIREKTILNDVKKSSDDFKGIIGKAVYEIEKIRTDKELGIINQELKYGDLSKKVTTIQKILFEIDKKIQNKLKRTEFNLKIAKDNLNEFLIREPFTEDYASSDISNNWILFNAKKGKGNPAKWQYFDYNIDGHSKIIKQTENFLDNRTGSHLILKNKDYYDFELRLSFMLKEGNTFGIAFRYNDPYNYYIFEISSLDRGFKRVRRFKNGFPNAIDQKNDGGCLQDTWYNLKIRGQQSVFTIYLTDLNGQNLDKLYEKQFEFIDNQFLHGTIAVTSNGMNSVLVDNISVIPIGCTNFDDSDKAKQIAISPTCSRYNESFKNGFLKRWKIIDPVDNTDGPSIWKTLNDVEDREMVLAQQSLIRGLSEYQEGTLFILNDNTKVCHNGKYVISMKALDEGIIGLIFRYENNNYYILEISGITNDKYIRIRKKIDDKFILVSTKPNIGYKKNIWFKIMLTIRDNKFNSFITSDTSQEDSVVQIFDNEVTDTDLKSGLLGISTYQTKVIISDITISPFDNLDILDDESNVYVDEEELDLPKEKLKDATIFDRINLHITNFSWSKCLKYPKADDRLRYCDLLFGSKYEIDSCRDNFCNSCCNKFVDITNKSHSRLCEKQCKIIEEGSNNKAWKNCIETPNPEVSIYPYCDDYFSSDFYQKSRCKIDMCNLCCVSLDIKDKPIYTEKAINSCYQKCLKTFNIKPPEMQK